MDYIGLGIQKHKNWRKTMVFRSRAPTPDTKFSIRSVRVDGLIHEDVVEAILSSRDSVKSKSSNRVSVAENFV